MNDLRDINRVLGYIPLIPLLAFLLIGLIGIIQFSEIPVYGINPDPSSLGNNWINGLAIITAFISFITIPTSILLTIHLTLNKIEFRKSDYLSLTVMAISILGFLVLKYEMSDFFLWIMD
ncbi:MAG: hypothetical protein R2852_02595 [Bacteroidia bacterium]